MSYKQLNLSSVNTFFLFKANCKFINNLFIRFLHLEEELIFKLEKWANFWIYKTKRFFKMKNPFFLPSYQMKNWICHFKNSFFFITNEKYPCLNQSIYFYLIIYLSNLYNTKKLIFHQEKQNK